MHPGSAIAARLRRKDRALARVRLAGICLAGRRPTRQPEGQAAKLGRSLRRRTATRVLRKRGAWKRSGARVQPRLKAVTVTASVRLRHRRTPSRLKLPAGVPVRVSAGVAVTGAGRHLVRWNLAAATRARMEARLVHN